MLTEFAMIPLLGLGLMDKYIFERTEIRVYNGRKNESHLELEMGLGLVDPSVSLGLAMVQSHQVTLFFSFSFLPCG